MVFYAKSQGVYLASCATPFYVITIFILKWSRLLLLSVERFVPLEYYQQAERRRSLLMITACE